MINYLESLRSLESVPLSCGVRLDNEPELPDEVTEEFIKTQEHIFNIPFEGPFFATYKKIFLPFLRVSLLERTPPIELIISPNVFVVALRQ